jgi:HSP20 family protein
MLTRRSDWNGFPVFGFREGSGSANVFDQLRRELDRVFFDFERATPSRFDRGNNAISVKDEGAAYVLRAELPGVSEKDIELSVTGNTLSLKAERKLEAPQGHSAHRTERSGWTLARSLELPVQVDSSAVVAELKHGILTVTLPKSKEALPKQISVKVS